MTEEVVTAVTEAVAEAPSPATIHDLKPKMKVSGKVQRIELYGAMVDLGLEATAILHISQIGGGKNRVNRVADALSVGDEVSVWVDKVDAAKGQITVTTIEPLAVEWSDLKEGQVYTGKVVRLEKFGAFLDIGAEKEGLVHVSELSHEFVKHPSEALNAGDEVQVKVLGFNKRKRRIDLSVKALLEAPESAQVAAVEAIEYDLEEEEEDEPMLTAMEIALRQAMQASGEALPPRMTATNKRRRQQNKTRSRQEEILSRTLQINRES